MYDRQAEILAYLNDVSDTDLVEAWNGEHPDGEGVMPGGEHWHATARARWIRVYRDHEMTRAIATFYVYTRAGRVVGMHLAQVRRGKTPSPYGNDLGHVMSGWSPFPGRSDRPPFAEVSRREREAVNPEADRRRFSAQSGARPVTSVGVTVSPDGDTRYQFPGFKVRASLLAEALSRFREAGEQRVSVDVLQQALGRL